MLYLLPINRGIAHKMYDAKSAFDIMRAANIDEKLGIKRELGGDYGVWRTMS